MKLTARGGEGLVSSFAKGCRRREKLSSFFSVVVLFFRAWNNIKKSIWEWGVCLQISQCRAAIRTCEFSSWHLTSDRDKKKKKKASANSQQLRVRTAEWMNSNKARFFPPIFCIMTVCFHKIIICVIPASLQVVACLVSAQSRDFLSFRQCSRVGVLTFLTLKNKDIWYDYVIPPGINILVYYIITCECVNSLLERREWPSAADIGVLIFDIKLIMLIFQERFLSTTKFSSSFNKLLIVQVICQTKMWFLMPPVSQISRCNATVPILYCI